MSTCECGSSAKPCRNNKESVESVLAANFPGNAATNQLPNSAFERHQLAIGREDAKDMARLSSQYSNNFNIQYVYYIFLPYFFIFFLYLFILLLYFLYSLPFEYVRVLAHVFFYFVLFILYMRSICFFIFIAHFIFWFRVRIFIFFLISMQQVIT